ncbi:unnamed protein product [Pieris macdunnoughi]|uniref:Uncharacterized protein n=1 Tax=Pieris macdunnoughi TaxID=345717 RepID=A0A821SDJ9_9NEOP|nr:unnamed protein product [Pieris macdunnoughi]
MPSTKEESVYNITCHPKPETVNITTTQQDPTRKPKHEDNPGKKEYIIHKIETRKWKYRTKNLPHHEQGNKPKPEPGKEKK